MGLINELVLADDDGEKSMCKILSQKNELK